MMHEVFFFCIFFHIDEKVQGLFKLVRISSKLLNQAIAIYKKRLHFTSSFCDCKVICFIASIYFI